MSFELDPFQREAIEHIDRGESVLVSAPTGSGKTLIAERAISHAFEAGKRVVYTAPIKALSNQKYRDFRAVYGDQAVGILTGDVTLNPQAPLLIMTTEIYRNKLFDNNLGISDIHWVVFDEIHYLDDPERGTVWEEALLFTPAETRILALSATAPNIKELAEWIRSIHDRPIHVIRENERPVPLKFYYQCQNRIYTDRKLLFREGYFQLNDWGAKHRKGYQRRLRAKPNRIDRLVQGLLERKRLPALYFAFGRRRTEYLAEEATPYDLLQPEERKKILETYDRLLESYQATEDRSAVDMRSLIERGIAFHHAGMLPSLKEIIEQLFTSRLIKLIFTTETFALGINMPARTVIFDELEKFYGTGFRPLSTRDFYQMAGRAGRRGMDEEGFVYSRLNPQHIAFSQVERIIYGPTEAISSQWNSAYATLLNLFRQLGMGLFSIYPKSFHYFQSRHKARNEALSLMERKLKLLREMGYLGEETLTPKGDFASSLFGYELPLSEMYAAGVLDELPLPDLCVILAGLIFEPRKGDHPPKLSGEDQRLLKIANHHHRLIHREEAAARVIPYTKLPHFHLANAIRLWLRGEKFDRLFRETSVDEGSLVRYFRMVIQLLREVASANQVSPELKAKARKAAALLNRDVVDAQRQLQV